MEQNCGCCLLTLRSPLTVPISLIPEIWEHIFSYLHDSHDFLSVINSCPEWNELLALRKPDELFPLVIPLLLEYIPRNTILLIREVCKNAKLGVDSVFSTQCSSSDKIFSHNRYRSQPKTHRIIERIRFRFTFLNGWNFLKVFRNHELNPFVTRSISILVGRNNYDGSSIKEMLSLFGKFVIRLYLQCCHEHVNHFNLDGEAVLAEILEILNLTPNLKSLKISTTPFLWPVISVSFQFPTLEQFEYLDVDDVNFRFIPGPIVCQYGQQIRVLGCNGTIMEMEGINEVVPNLRKLRVQFVSSRTLKIISEMSGWSLEALKLRSFEDQVDAHDVLTALANFSETLVELDLVCNVNYNEVGRIQGKEIVNSDKAQFREALKKAGVFGKLEILNTEWNLVKSEWFNEFIFGKCPFLQEICVYSELESVVNELESFEKELLHLSQMKKFEFWVWERGRFVLRHRKLFTPSMKNCREVRTLETLQCEYYSGPEENQQPTKESKLSSICCHQ